MRFSRPVRLIFGVLILVLFGWYMARWMSVGVMSNDVGKPQSAPVAAAPAVEAAPAVTAVEVPVVTAEPTPTPTPTPPPRPEELKAAALGLPSPPAIDKR